MKYVDPVVTLFGREPVATLRTRLHALLSPMPISVESDTGNQTLGLPDVAIIQLRCLGELTNDHRMQLLSDLDSGVDLVIQSRELHTRGYQLACFDMDSTLIQAEVIDELAKLAGVGDDVAAITASAMRGELDFKASFTRRMRLLEGLSETQLQGVASSLPFMPGLKQMMQGLKERGVRTAILSGGFTYFAEYLQAALGFDEIHANTLEFQQGVLSGRAVEPIVDGARKAHLLQQIAAQHGIPLEHVIAVGDGANDLPMISLAGLGVAFHAKPKVQAEAQYSLTIPGLDGLLSLFAAE